MTRILVTTPTGSVGRHVVDQLPNAFVRVLARDASAVFADVEIATSDLDDETSVRRAMRGVDRVYLSAPDGPSKVAHETAVIDAATEAGVSLIVKLSAQHADPASPLPPFRWHGEIENHLRRSGVPFVILRSTFFMTNLLMVADAVASTGVLPAPTARRAVAMIDPRDVAASAAATLLAGGPANRVHDLTGPSAVTFDDVAAALSAATGRPVRSMDLTEAEARPRFEGAGLPGWLATHLSGVFALIRAGAFEKTTDHVRALTGRPPRDVSAFARDHAAAFGPAGQRTVTRIG
ncbi:NmrA family NAD(P)-binding protein [Actinoplanes solisilvae]|uniref:NmrA family NAD(P)-binding protein n=1 Tax=Actinoplanes solisilvae TaxID=2486853 RepID=UPI000FDC2AA3|nr:NmrA family NAD(P)-binding protein [Actinoplanes solisilvae]